ncbi:MAG TPA: ABC transporter substrate-binding protein [Trebonia sp.]|nr:ABC transporter substrate-binding protein [Trebonia sp.]
MPSRYLFTVHARARCLGRRTSILAIATLAAGTLVACGGVSNGGGAATSTTTGAADGTASAASGATTGQASAAPTGIVGNTLTLQFNQPVSTNPALGGTAESDVVFGAIDYDSLIYQLGDGQYVGDLATSWGYAPGSKNEVFNLTLRKNVHFSDGSLLTPASVVNSLEYFKKADGPQAGYLASLTSAKATGTDTVQLTFATPEPNLPFLLSQYQDIGQIIGPQGIANPKTLTTTSDGTGPYVLSAAQSVANSQYVFTQNSHYWNPAAVHYKQVAVKVITDPQTALSAAESGQVDALLSLPSTAQQSARSHNLTTFSQPFSIASLILMGRSDPKSPLSNLKVRQAINDAVDRASLAQGLGGGSAVPTDEFALPGSTGYDPAEASTYSFDVAKAKSLLTQAGYGSGFKLNVLDTLALDANGDIGAALKSELANVGIDVTLTETPSPAQFIPAALSKQYDAVIWPLSQNGDGFPYAVQFAMAPFTNAFGTTSTQLDTLMGTAGALSGAAATTAYQKVGDYLTDNAWFVPLFSLSATFAVAPTVTNVQAPSLKNTTIDPIAPIASLSWYPSSK